MDIIRPLISNFVDQIEGVKNSKDFKYIHDMRVASRRLRAAIRVFSPCFAKKDIRRARKAVRRIARVLGLARDRDVQILFLKNLIGKTEKKDLRIGMEYLNRLLEQDREHIQRQVLKEISRLEKSMALEDLQKIIEEYSLWKGVEPEDVMPELLSRAERDIRARIDELRGYEEAIRDPSRTSDHHAMRIAAKRLRYTMEIYFTIFQGEFRYAIKKVRRLQNILGELHDTDVWIETLPRILERERAALSGIERDSVLEEIVLPGILYLMENCKNMRAEQYQGALGYWEELKSEGFFEGLIETCKSPRPADSGNKEKNGQEEQKRRIEEVIRISRKYQADFTHMEHVTELALSLFEDLKEFHRLKSRQKTWLQYAGLLHDIGYAGGVQGHQKRGLGMILDEPELPFTRMEKFIVGSIVRYHGKEIPSPRHHPYRLLSSQQQRKVRILASILRMADALDVSHGSIVSRVHAEFREDKFIVHCYSTTPSVAEESAFSRKKDLFEETFGHTVEISWRDQ